MSGMKQEAIRKSESNYAVELTALRQQVADLRAALMHVSMAEEYTPKSCQSCAGVHRVLAATQPQEVQP